MSSYTNSCFSVGKGIQTLLLNINYYSLEYLMLISAFVYKSSHIPSYQHVFRDFDEQVKCALRQFVEHRIK